MLFVCIACVIRHIHTSHLKVVRLELKVVALKLLKKRKMRVVAVEVAVFCSCISMVA